MGAITVTIPGGLSALASTAIISLRATDDRSGVGAMQISNQSSFAGASWEAYTTTRSWTMGSSDTVYARFRDNAGNVSAIYSALPTPGWKVFLPLIVK